MSNKPQLPSIRENVQFQREMRNLMITWGICCCSSVLYLATSFLIKRSLLPEGLYPLGHDLYVRVLIALAIISGIMQGAILLVKNRNLSKLRAHMEDVPGFISLITKRTFTLLMLCEIPVALGFCLFLVHGDFTPVFAFGMVSMMLYAQSHPRAANPAFPS